MYTIRYALVFVLLLFFGISKVESQITDVDFLIQYNPETCLYEACIVIVGGSATTYPQRIQFNSQYSIVVPAGTTMSIDTLFNPKEANQFYTGTKPCLWEFGPTEYSPPIQPQHDFYTVFPNLSPPSAYNNLMPGDTVRLFGISTDLPDSCTPEIRPFINGVDPSSLNMPSGGDFSNGFTFGGGAQVYRENLEVTPPPLPEIDYDIDCNGDITINVTPLDSLMCQHPYGYIWTGPSGSGFFSTDESPIIPEPATPGIYEAFITDSYGCDTTIYIYVEGLPNVTSDQTICGAGNVTLEDITGSGTGMWSLDPSNTIGASVGNTSGGVAIATFDVTATGSYLFIYSGDGCDAQTEITVVTSTSVPNANNNGPLCVGDNLMLTTDFVVGATYSWSGPGFTSTDQNPIISNVSLGDAGIYTLIVTAGGCPSSPASTTVVINNTPSPPVVSNNGPICEGEDLNLTTGMVSGGTYLWTGPGGYTTTDQNPIITGATPMNTGSYCLVVTVNGCESIEVCTDATVNGTPSPPVVSNNGPICEGEDLNLTTGTVSGGTYLWTGPGGYTTTDQNPIITGATPMNTGSYCLVVSVLGCESIEVCTDVTVNGTPSPPVVSNNGPICEGEDLNLMTGTVSGGTYLWTGPGGYTTTDQNPIITGATPMNTGSYCLVVTVNGCESIEVCTDVTVNGTPSPPVVSNNGPICEGEDLNLTTGTVSGGTYLWTGPGGYTTTDQNPIITGATPMNTGSYCLVVTVNGCESIEVCTDATVNGTPSPPVVSNNGPICEGEDLNLTTGTVSGGTYLWTGPGGYTTTDQNPIITGATPMNTGSYCLVVTVNGCESIEVCTDATVNGTPSPPVVSNNGPICEGEDLNLMTGTVSGGTYLWTGPGGYTATDQNPIITGATPMNTGSYCLVVTVNGCESIEVCTDAAVNGTPSPPVVSNNGPICEGEDLNLTTGTVSGGTYLWTGPGGYTTTDQNPIITGATPMNTGSYCLVVTVNGCESIEVCTDAAVNGTPSPPVVSNNGPICEGEDLNLTTGTVSGGTYLWTGPGGYTATDQNPIITGATPMNTGSYCLVVTVNGCESIEVCTDAAVNGTPSLPVVSNNGPICEGEDLNLMTGTVSGGTYLWTGPGGYTATDQNPIITGATPMNTGSYCLVVTVNGCESIEVCTDAAVNGTPSLPVVSNNGPICEGEDLNLMTGTVSGGTYLWTGPGGYTATDQNPIITGATPMNTGSYCLVVTVNGCESIEVCTDVTVNGTPSPPIVSNNGPICEGEDLNLTTGTVSGGTYLWTGPGGYTTTDQNPIITGATPMNTGSYCLVVTVNGCESIEVCTDAAVNGTPSPPVVSNNGPICEGEDLNLTTGTVSGGTYLWTGPGGYTATDQNPIITGATPMNTGSYCLVVTVNGCESIEVCTDATVNGTPSPPVVSNNGPICEGEDLNLTTGTVSGGTYLWTGPGGYTATDQNPIITGATPMNTGSYCLVVTVNGCESIEVCTDVTVNGTPSPPVVSNNGPICEGEDLNLTTGTVSGGTYLWTGPGGYTATDQNPIITGATPMNTGSYCLVVSVLGCESIEVCTDATVNGTPSPPVVSNNGPICEGEDLNLTTGTVSGGTYLWTGPGGYTATDQNPIITGATPMNTGSYCLVVTVNGCESIEVCTDVTVNGTPSPSVVSNNGPICEGEDLNLTTGTVSGGTYLWTGPGGYTATDQNPIITGATPMNTGSYCLVVTVNGCESIEVCTDATVNGTPSPPVVSNNGPICEGEDLNLTTGTVSGGTYLWTGPGGYTATDQNPIITGATPMNTGSYCLVVTVNGCESIEVCTDATVNGTPSPPVVSNNGPICEGEDLNLTTGTVSGGTYLWTGPGGYTATDQNPIITGATPMNTGSYCLVVSVLGCESIEVCTDVTVNGTPSPPVVSNNGPICEGEDLNLTTGTVSGGTYLWTGPGGYTATDQNPIITGATPMNTGSYCLVVSVLGCESIEVCTDATVNGTPSPPVVSNNGPICEGEDLNLTTGTVSGGTYLWTGPGGYTTTDQNPIITGATPMNTGSYCLVVTVNGCESIEVCTDATVNGTPSSPVVSNNGPICEGEDLNLTTGTVSGGTYLWTGPGGYTTTDQNPIITGATPMNTGSYCLVVTVNGCESIEVCTDATVNGTPSPPVVSNNGPICEGEDLNLMTGTVSGGTYLWTGPGGYTTTDQNPIITGATPMNTGSYCLVVTVNGCESIEVCTDATVNGTPSPPVVSNNGPICEGEDLNLTTGTVSGGTYLWTGPGGYTTTDQNPIITGATPMNTGSYCLVVTVNGCESIEVCTDATVNGTPSPPVVSNNGPICEGEDLNLMTGTVSGGTYLWTGPGGYTTTDQNPIITGATPMNTGSYCLVVSVLGCESIEVCTDATVNGTPSPPVVNNNGPICEGEDLNLMTGTVSGGTYLWTGPGGYTTTDQNPIITGATPMNTGSYCLVVTVNGCESIEVCTDATVNGTPSPPVVSNNGPICEGEDLNLTTGTVSGGTYLWTGPGGYTTTDQNPIITGATPMNTGSYCLVVSVLGCESIEVCTDATVNGTPSPPVVNNNGPICEGEDLNLMTGTVSGGTYLWTGPGGYTTTDQNPIITGATPMNTGSYCLVVTVNGCESIEVCTDATVNGTPSPPVVNNNGPICEGEDLNLTTGTVSGGTYLWTGPGGYTTTDQNPIITGATPMNTGSYCLVVSVLGCESIEVCTDVTVNGTPSPPVVSNNGPICEGEDLNLTTGTVSGGTYLWTGPGGYTTTDQNPIITGATPMNTGSYCLVVSVLGCESIEVCTDVTVNGTPSPPVVSNNGPICEGEDLNLTTGTVSGGTYLWTGPGGYTTTDQNPIITGATPMNTGSYCLVVSVLGCESIEVCTDVTVNGTPSPPVVSNNGPICEGEDLNLTTGTVSGGTYLWTGPGGYTATDQNPIITGATPMNTGSYCLVVSVLGCESIEVCTDVTVNGTPSPPVVSNNGPICEGEDLNLTTGTVSGGTYLWTGPGGYTATDQNPIITGATPMNTGSYCLVVTVNGCESEARCTEVTISPEISAGSDQSILCAVLSEITVTMDATSTNNGTWSTGANPGSVSIGTLDSETTTITNFTVVGRYTFIWSNGICSDEVEIIVTAQPVAGEDQFVKCNLTGSAIMAAEGNGTWSLGNAAGTVTFDDSEPNTVVTDFENPGAYELIWTIEDCSDTVVINVDDDCECPITDNIIDGNPEDYCGTSEARFIEGQESTPPGGTYTWQYNDGSGFIDIVGSNSKDYTTMELGIGIHEFRRIYSIGSPDCSDTSNHVIMDVLQQPLAGADQELLCQNLATLQIVMNGSGIGIWNQESGSGTATIVTNDDANTIIDGITIAGTYIFSFGNDVCSDEVSITITEEANAGPDQSVNCFATGSAIMSAVANSNGSWSWGTTPGDQPTLDVDDENVVITGFAESGSYELIWTVGDCSDSAIIVVGEDCDCPIANNNIDQPNPSQFCGESLAIEIIGSVATPDGAYTWEYSFNSGAFAPVSGVNNQQNYTTGILSVGTHRFRRVYETTSAPICTDFSNIIEITVLDQPNAGEDQSLSCIDLPGGSLLMNGSAIGIWSALDINSGSSNIVDPDSSNTEINGFTDPGTYGFILTNEVCTDTAFVYVTESVNAGEDQNVECYIMGSATMAAVSINGTWSVGVIPAAAGSNPNIVSPGSPNTAVDNFDASGTYELIWTVGNCSDIVQIVVGEDCDCPIAGNNIIQPVLSEYCDASPMILIEGSDAIPADGTYVWEYFNNSNFVPANGTNNQRDYTTESLTVGKHRFRRIYNIETPMCQDTSNEVLITVTQTPDAGVDQTLECIDLPGSITMDATGTGEWMANSGNPSLVTILEPLSSTTAIVGLTNVGDYFFTYSNGICSDEMMVSVTQAADAGANQSVTCFLTGTASLSATGVGTWSYGMTTNGDQPPFVMNSANTTISGFAGDGTYELIWTSNGCSDTIIITVGDNCSCPISSNVITQPSPDEFCELSDDITIIGLDAAPVGGEYIWEYSTNGIDFNLVPNISDQRDYSTGNLSVGEYSFRRIYDLESPNCNDTSNVVTIIVLAQPNAGVDQDLTCVQVPTTAIMTGTGPGVWTSNSSNPSVTIVDGSATTEITGLVSGVYFFTFSNGICSDEVRISVTAEANAGVDQLFDCFETATAVMNASGSGSWSWGATPGGDQPTLDDTNPNTSITGFGFEGDYNLIWTNEDGCTDGVLITVGAVCDCPIADNIINQPSPNNLCGTSSAISIIGLDGTPANGTYSWEYSLEGGVFVPANGTNNQRDYTTDLLAAGEHRYRRIYTVSDPIACEDISNIVSIVVNTDANAGSDQIVECYEDGVATMAASGDGEWSWSSSETATIDTDDPNTTVSNFPSAGTYVLIWTTDEGCTDEVSIVVDDNCACPIEDNTITQPDPNEFCGASEVLTILGLDATPAGGTYAWEYSFNNGAFSSANGSNDQRDYTTGVLSIGEHRYRRVYAITSPIECDDVSNVVLIVVYENADAGPDQTVECYEDGVATMAASGDGEWSWSSSETATIDADDPNTTVSNFPSAGTYVLIWTTDEGCTDEVSIVVDDNCACPIEDNTITQPDPNEFCGASEVLTILGLDATPAGGTYAWEYSFNNGAFSSANGSNDQRDYTTGVLSIGEHRYRRVYAITSPIECDDVSNVVLIVVYENADAGPDQTVECYEDGVATMAASGDGEWSWSSSETATIDADDPNTTVSNFPSAGTYVLIWTTDEGCTDEVSIVVDDNCACPIEDNTITQPDPNEFCGASEVLTILGLDATPAGGTYAWEYSFNNGAFSSANGSNDQRDYTTGVLSIGEHRYRRVYAITSPIECDDVSNVVLIVVYENADAGPDQTVECYEDGVATMAASGDGEWSWSSSETATIDADDPNTTVSNFPSAGTYVLIWTTDEGCTDEVSIVVDDNCACPIEDNTITQPDPNEFCGASEVLTILGLDATPAGGTYAWEYSFNNGAFSSANGSNDQRDYTTGVLSIGEHRYRRVYAITSPIECDDVSNVVLIVVYENADAGPDQTVDCYEDGVATMAASGDGEWSWSSSETATIDADDPNTTVSNFPSAGTYVLIWTTDEGCTDEVIIVVGDDCFDCTIMNNDIDQPIPSDFCNESPEITIVGGSANPTNGVYTWEYSFNGSPFEIASGDTNQSSYNTPNLGPGEHRFRRRYLIELMPLCEDVSDIIVINVLGPIDAGEDQHLGCVDLENTEAIMAAIGSGIWTQSDSNPGLVNLSGEDDPNATITGFVEAGTYTFIWSSGMCTDEMTIYLEEKKDAGEDRFVECYVDGVISLNAEGSGSWSIGPNNPGTVQLSLSTDPKAVLTNFSINGIYEFIWTVNGCDDIVIVEVGETCPCLVESNSVIDNVSDVFCETTGDLFITGEEALPVGGTYLWQISIKGSGFSNAPGVNNTKDYDASNLGEGTYILRRQYTLIIDGVECSEISNEIEFFVFNNKQNPGEIHFTPNPVCLGDTLILEVDFDPNLIYEWQIMSGSGRVLYSLDSMSMIVVESPGVITVSVTQYLEGCDNNEVSTASELDINVFDTPQPYLGRDTTYCELEESFTIYPGDFEEYEWQDGSGEADFLVEGQGIYSVSVMDSMGCVGNDMINIKSFCCEFAYPNIFKADSDGSNSEFKITDIYDCVIESELLIYDRWGNLVFIGDGLDAWDGTFKGKFVEQGVYVFIYKYKAIDADREEFEDEVSGDVTVLR